ncbi:Mobile element protein [Bacillus mycoides]|nr:Mobile element protein [Bacillus mycoides]
MFRFVPNNALSKAINSYKSVSSRFLKRDFPKIKHDLWKEMFWSRSYCLLTTGGVPIDSIRKYIESQGKQ